MPEPASLRRQFTTPAQRERARRIRDRQWRFMERVVAVGTLWFCVWNKRELPEGPDEWRDGLMTGLEMMNWIQRHATWFVAGEWDEAGYAWPVQLTEAGHAALADRALYDMEPVEGGLVAPGWTAVPAEVPYGVAN